MYGALLLGFGFLEWIPVDIRHSAAGVGEYLNVCQIFWPRAHRPIYWQNRLGRVWFDDPDRDRWDGLSGWVMSAFEWNMEEGLSVEASVEGYIGERQQTRLRSLVSVKMENWW